MPRVAHWLPTNASTRYPRRVVALGVSEITSGSVETGWSLVMGAAAASDIDMRHRERRATRIASGEFTDTEALWEWVGRCTRRRERTVVVAHDLAVVLRLTDALDTLTSQGWAVSAHAMGGLRVWLRLTREGCSLTLVDSRGWVDGELATLARELGDDDPHLHTIPSGDDGLRAQAQARCVATTMLALRYLDWCERQDMGAWRLTAAAQGWAAYRHKWMPERIVLCHDDAMALAAERIAGWTGRTEAWRHGTIAGPLYEWDYRASYAQLAYDHNLPVRLVSHVMGPHPKALVNARRTGRYLAHCAVTTDSPAVPSSHEGRIVWGVGTFDTWLWDCEVELARSEGAQVDVSEAYYYGAAPALRRWASWVLDELHGAEPCDDPIARRVIKGWSRSLIGRFGMQVPEWDTAGPAPWSDVSLIPTVDGHTGHIGVTLQVGHDLWIQTGEHDATDAAPAVMTCVIAEARCRLWRAIGIAGADHVVYMDTDSLVVDQEGHDALLKRPSGGEHAGLRLRDVWDQITINGPRSLTVNGRPRISGLPRGAVMMGAGVWRARVTEQLTSALASENHDRVVVRYRTVRTCAHDERRTQLHDGTTTPLRLGGPKPPE